MFNPSDIHQSLLDYTVKLFSVIASVDGEVSPQEENYVKKYFEDYYQARFANALFRLFREYANQSLDATIIIAEINDRLQLHEKVFLLLKLYELTASDQVDPAELTLLRKLGSMLLDDPEDVIIIENLVSKSYNELANAHMVGKDLRYICMGSSRVEHEIYLGLASLKLILVRVQHSLIVVQKDHLNRVKVGRRRINPGFASYIPFNQSLLVAEQLEVTFEDLRFYFQQAERPVYLLYLYKLGPSLRLTQLAIAKPIACFKVQQGNLVTAYVNGQYNLLIEGLPPTEGQPISLNALLQLGSIHTLMRKLLQDPILKKEELRLEGESLEITIGNQFEHDIIIDDIDFGNWQCSLQLRRDQWTFSPDNCPYPVYHNDQRIYKSQSIQSADTIHIGRASINFDAEKQSFSKSETGFQKLEIKEVGYLYPQPKNENIERDGIRNMSFSVTRGEVIGIMGPSGSGKSTLLRLLNGQLSPQEGSISIDGQDFRQIYPRLKDFIGYVPQDDLLLENLTVYENLYYSAQLRHPGDKRNLETLVNRVIRSIGLYHKKNEKVGSISNKHLSGGERKRLNIGLELLSDHDLLFLDEPTTGLSSKDSEKIMELIRKLGDEGKMVFVVIHQPGARLFKLFDKITLVDRGGRLAFFGPPEEALVYFADFSVEQGKPVAPHLRTDPAILLEVLETSEADLDGTAFNIRSYSPDFWEKRFKEFNPASTLNEETSRESAIHLPVKFERNLKESFLHFKALLQRNFTNKKRDRANFTLTFLIPPMLGILIAFILRYSTQPEYFFYTNPHIITYLFLSTLVSVFLGLTNSIEEIIKDRKILIRERMLDLSLKAYYFSKLISLWGFAFIQNILFLLPGVLILGFRDFNLIPIYLLILLLVSLAGIALGLLVSAIPGLSSKAAINLVPVILVPQIIFGGALVEYDKMNRQLTFFVNDPVPEICQLMPSRWGFEALVSIQGAFNRYHTKERAMMSEIQDAKRKRASLKKEAEINSTAVAIVDSIISVKSKARDEFIRKYRNQYGNTRIDAAIRDAETQRKFALNESPPKRTNPLFSTNKYYFLGPNKTPTSIFNGGILIVFIFIFGFTSLLLLRLSFKR